MLARVHPHRSRTLVCARATDDSPSCIRRVASHVWQVRGEQLMQQEDVMLRAITRAQHEAELADALDEVDDEAGSTLERQVNAVNISTPR